MSEPLSSTVDVKPQPDDVVGRAPFAVNPRAVQGRFALMAAAQSTARATLAGPHSSATMAKPGSGARFGALDRKLAHRKGVTDPAALAAWIGRRKYGGAKFAKFSKAGMRRGRK